MLQDFKIQLKENKSKDSQNVAQYILTYTVHGPKKDPKSQSRENSYEIISALKSDNDVIIEINSSLLNMAGNQKKQEYVFKLLESIKALGLEYRYRKMNVAAPSSMFSLVLGKKNIDEHEVLVYVSKDIWKTNEFQNIMPAFGAKYNVYDGSLGADECLDNMYRLTDDEKLDFFRIILYDPGVYNQMAFNSRHLGLEDGFRKGS
jgi:hypothetical protein